jgi:dihydrofolate reductase
MPTPRLIVYIAASADGYIATPDGGIDWLAAYDASRYGYDEFIASVGAIVMGRATYDGILRNGDWPYPGKKAFVLTHRPLTPPAGVEAEAFDDLDRLIEKLRRPGRGDVWIEGGGMTIRALLDRGAVDRIDLFVIPILLGDGIRLFPPSATLHRLTLEASRAHPDGVVALSYRVEPFPD